MANSAVQKQKASVAIRTESFQKIIAGTLREPKQAARFTASIISAVSVNPALQDCDPVSILSCGFLGESLGLSPSPQLGHYYMVPFSGKAAFILGYRALIQLAARSGNYKDITVEPIKKGELISYNPITGEISLNPIEDVLERETSETIGYYASFEYLNGFKKSMYWTKEKMTAHARRYSKSYNSFWGKDKETFDTMACKSMLRQLLGKWGLLSPEMETAYVSDNAVINQDLTPDVLVDTASLETAFASAESSPVEPLQDKSNDKSNDKGNVISIGEL